MNVTPEWSSIVPTSVSQTLALRERVSHASSSSAGAQHVVNKIRFNHTGEYAVTCKNRAVFLVNPKTDVCLKTYEGAHAREVRDCVSSRDNSKLASVGGDKGVFVWDVKTGQTVRRFIGHDAFGVNCVKFLLGHSNEESVIVSCGFDRCVKFWDLRSNRQHEAMETVGSQFSDAAMDLTLSGGRGGGKTNEVTACSIDGTVRTFDIRKGELRVDTLFGQQPVTAVENSADDRLVLATLPKTVALMDKTTGEVLQTFSGFNNDQNVVLRATFTPDDRYIVLGDAVGDICIWDVLSNGSLNSQPQRIPNAHAKSISNVCFHPSEASFGGKGGGGRKKHLMLSCAADGFAKFWS